MKIKLTAENSLVSGRHSIGEVMAIVSLPLGLNTFFVDIDYYNLARRIDGHKTRPFKFS